MVGLLGLWPSSDMGAPIDEVEALGGDNPIREATAWQEGSYEEQKIQTMYL